MRNLTPTTWICLAGLGLVLCFAVFGETAVDRMLAPKVIDAADDVPGARLTRLPLPATPERALIERNCQACHHLSRIEKAGGTEEDWSSRIDRMIRNGARIPEDDIAPMVAYLAWALPARPVAN